MPALTQTVNHCVCGNAFSHDFSGNWEKVERNGRVYARCGKEAEAFFHGRNQYWVWPIADEN